MKRGREGKGGRPLPAPPPSQFATPLSQASPSRRPGLGDLTWLEDFLTSKWPGSFTAVVPRVALFHETERNRAIIIVKAGQTKRKRTAKTTTVKKGKTE